MTDKFTTRKLIIINDDVRRRAVAMVENCPLGIEIIALEPVKARKLDQNALYWSGPLADIAEQAWVDGRKFSAEVWHEHLKRQYLPESDNPEIDRMVKGDNWRKWDYLPDGERVMVGSTTDLTVYGFSQYLEQIYAFGASLGVMFRAGK